MAVTTATERPAISVDQQAQRPTWVPWVIAGITILAAGLRIAGLHESFYGDELFTYEIALRGGLPEVLAGVRSNLEITPPLFFVLTWLFGKVGDPFVSLRVVSLLCSTATVPLLYLLGRRTMGWGAGLVAGAFWALSPMALFYGIEARSYALMNMLMVLAALAVLRALDSQGWGWWAVVTVIYTAGVYTNYTCIFVLAALAAWALVTHRDKWRHLLVSLAVAVLLYLPWLPSMIDDRNAPNQKIYNFLMPTTPRVVVNESIRALAQGPYLQMSMIPTVLLGLAAFVALAGLVVRLMTIGKAALPATTVLVLLMAVAAPIGLLTQSLIGDDMYGGRNLTSSLPAAYLLFAGLLVALPRVWRAVGMVLAFAGFIVGAARTFQVENQRPNYRQVGQFIEQQAQPGAGVVEIMPFSGPPSNALRIHLDPSLRYQRVPVPAEIPQAMEQPAPQYFVVMLNVPPPEIPGYRRVEARTFPGVVTFQVGVYEPTGT